MHEPLPETGVVSCVLISSDEQLSLASVLNRIRGLHDIDDVFQEGFTQNLLLQIPEQRLFAQLDQLEKPFKHVFSVENGTDSLIPSGPYFLYNSKIYQAWRLYEDDLDAFVVPIIPNHVKSPKK